MASVLTQIQDEVDRFTGQLFTSVGVLQRDAPPSTVAGEKCPLSVAQVGDASKPAVDNSDIHKQAKEFAIEMARTLKRIDVLIDALPTITSPSSQIEQLTLLREEDRQASEYLSNVVKQADELLSTLRDVSRRISDDVLQLRLKNTVR
mmetsp:Transcript_4569/g.7078  ORF Transcript_4569/g.7078 Transcript_4569/m.7078 type:complete len:148 (+) Transcript_4569:33-476(+)|eukprot:CAMPEP_0184656036 /NCGR_PEP_ID=MMETSP0308-20130426/15400_1 /TAXON_ID=38269 /ORGANISM="Gloeochaete witrockiana, Strain SAG 46.84" /LENGTH=147 /DNA_ID=CAMNT_0027092937 /DNA_START=30 /DNA_END=473 /DNA_ORIENTATION=-